MYFITTSCIPNSYQARLSMLEHKNKITLNTSTNRLFFIFFTSNPSRPFLIAYIGSNRTPQPEGDSVAPYTAFRFLVTSI